MNDDARRFIELTEYLDTQWDKGNRSSEIVVSHMLLQIWSKLDEIRYWVESKS